MHHVDHSIELQLILVLASAYVDHSLKLQLILALSSADVDHSLEHQLILALASLLHHGLHLIPAMKPVDPGFGFSWSSMGSSGSQKCCGSWLWQ
jgi:hypothetical protein